MRQSIRLAVVATLILGGWTAAGASEVIALNPTRTGLELEAGESEILHLQVSEVRLDRVEIDGADWAVVKVSGAQNLMDRGLPSLPYLTGEYLLGRSDAIALELISVTMRDIALENYGFAGVAPSKGHFDRGTDPATIPWVFVDEVYDGDARFPSDDVRLDHPFIAGPLRGQAFRAPVAFWRPDTNTLMMVEEATFRVVGLPEGANPRTGPDRPMTGLFDASARLHALNYNTLRSPDIFVETGRLLVIADDDFLDEVAPLAEWEILVGYPTTVIPTSVAGSTANQIKTFIQSVYDEPEGLSWIILVGDAPQIPTPTGVNEGADCDACYTKLEGADNRPDASISRISAQTEAQVTVQVDKILDYERFPDSGSAGAWYSRGFGVAFDGGSPPDYERMNWLRDDLLAPGFNYTEFDQIYDPTATAADVITAVNAGRSLGLYIGHGSKTAWSTTGFSVSHINSSLTNADTQPVIWSVACVNGAFVSGGDCFGEAWLKKDGGGAISFEGATTNESWVPPCDAQRGIIDSLRLETSFTTGGQHLAGKQKVMDVWGDGNSSEGTKWVEQSTLFGSCTTWMRTQPALAPDEPDDFSSVGGSATLTVKVGGTPLTKAGGALVSFYDEVGGVNILGSGLIDAGGVVTATVTREPTHCHIHGQNLIPTSFELQVFAADPIFEDGFETGDCTMWSNTFGER